jgi:hypothetical protein
MELRPLGVGCKYIEKWVDCEALLNTWEVFEGLRYQSLSAQYLEH